jgi:hypothetical protein
LSSRRLDLLPRNDPLGAKALVTLIGASRGVGRCGCSVGVGSEGSGFAAYQDRKALAGADRLPGGYENPFHAAGHSRSNAGPGINHRLDTPGKPDFAAAATRDRDQLNSGSADLRRRERNDSFGRCGALFAVAFFLRAFFRVLLASGGSRGLAHHVRQDEPAPAGQHHCGRDRAI